MAIYLADAIVPGSSPSYELCKTIYSYHPLGKKMVDAPVALAQSLQREIHIEEGPEDDLIEAYWDTWNGLGKVGADRLIAQVMTLSRAYGIGSLGVGTVGETPDKPLKLKPDSELYFVALDPLNTAGSLVLSQDPQSPDFMKPVGVRVGPQTWHASRTVVVMNEQPIYIEWSNSAFGFVGRSVFQRALYPLKSFIGSMIADDRITRKCMLLVAKMKAPSSVVDARSSAFFGQKRRAIQMGETGNVLSIGIEESVESLDLENVESAGRFARDNILKNIAAAGDMPASMLNQETLAEGFGEGSEDAKQIARYIDGVRVDMTPLYLFMDDITMQRAWSPEFYETIQAKYPDAYGDMPYDTAFYQWKRSYKTTWPNLLVEPDSKMVERDSKVMESVIGIAAILAPALDPENKAALAMWVAEAANTRDFLKLPPLEIDGEALAEYVPPTPEKETEDVEVRADAARKYVKKRPK